MPPGPPPRRRNNVPLIIGGIVGAVVLLVAVVAVIGMSGDDGNDPAKPPTAAAGSTGAARAGKVAQSLGTVPALRYSGTFSSSGDEFETQLTVTKAGSATGTITVGGAKSDIVSVDDSTYLKAPRSFWRSQGGVTSNAEDFAGRWAKAPASALNLDIKEVLAPGAIVQALQGVSSYQPGTPQDINGTPAVKITGADAEYYVSTAEPPKLLRIVGTGSNIYQLDVTEVSTGEISTLFQQLRSQVKALDGARDPSIRFIPTGRIKSSGCGVSSCTMKLTVRSISLGGDSSRVRVVMLGKITAGSRSGRTLGTCSDSATASSSRGVNLSCTVRGGAWSSWARSVRGSASYYIQARTVAEAGDTGGLLSAIDREQQAA